MKRCPSCHRQVDDRARFCPVCGTKLTRMPQNQPSESDVFLDQSRKLLMIGFLLLDLVLSTVLAFIGVPNIWVFCISVCFYALAAWKAFKGLRIGRHLKSQGRMVDGLWQFYILLSASAFLMVVNTVSIFQYLSIHI